MKKKVLILVSLFTMQAICAAQRLVTIGEGTYEKTPEEIQCIGEECQIARPEPGELKPAVLVPVQPVRTLETRIENIKDVTRQIKRPEGTAGGPDITPKRSEHYDIPAIKHGEEVDKQVPRFVAPNAEKQ